MADTKPAYVVKIGDNFDFTDEAERSVDGTYPDCEAALARCMQIVDESLFGLYKPFGDDPWIATSDAPNFERT